jgi:hypothetical protein
MTRRRRLDLPQMIIDVAGSAVSLANTLHALAPEVPEFMVARKMLQDGLHALQEQAKADAGGGR